MDIYSNVLKPMKEANKITFRNLITWKKENDNPTMFFNGACSNKRRKYYTNEKCLFVMCGVQGFNNNADHYSEIFEPIRLYLVGEARKIRLTPKTLKKICGVGMFLRWFSKSQFTIINRKHYKELQRYYNGKAFNMAYNNLRKLFKDSDYKSLRETIIAQRAYFNGSENQNIDVWVHDITGAEERKEMGGHASPKPIALCIRAIKASSRENEIILDLFGGSGSTLIACEKTGRKCRMIELEPRYCDVIVKRWEKLTGQKAVLSYG